MADSKSGNHRTAPEIPENQLSNDCEFLESKMGDGLRGDIFKVTQKSLAREVAVKFIKLEWGRDALKHARAIARISGHTNKVADHMVDCVTHWKRLTVA